MIPAPAPRSRVGPRGVHSYSLCLLKLQLPDRFLRDIHELAAYGHVMHFLDIRVEILILLEEGHLFADMVMHLRQRRRLLQRLQEIDRLPRFISLKRLHVKTLINYSFTQSKNRPIPLLLLCKNFFTRKNDR